MSSDLISYLGLGLAVVGIPFTYFVSRYFANRRGISWYFRERKVLDPVGGDFPDGVQLFFDGVNVAQLSEWNIGIWNSGNQSLTSQDVVRSLSFQFENCQVIKCSQVSSPRDGVTGNITQTDAVSCVLDFHFLDPSDGLVFTIYTTGDPTDGEPFDTSLAGTVIGVPKGPQQAIRLRNWDRSQIVTGIVMGLITISVPIVLFVYGISYHNIENTASAAEIFSAIKENTDWVQISPLLLGIIMGILYIPMGLMFLFNAVSQLFSSVPENVKQLAVRRDLERVKDPVRRLFLESLTRTFELMSIR